MSPPMWMHLDDVEPRHFSLRGPETNVYECISLLLLCLSSDLTHPTQDDIGSKKTMQMFSNGDQAHDKFNAAYIDRFEEILPQTGYTEDHWNKIVLEVKLCSSSIQSDN